MEMSHSAVTPSAQFLFNSDSQVAFVVATFALNVCHGVPDDHDTYDRFDGFDESDTSDVYDTYE